MQNIPVNGANPIVTVDDDECYRELIEFVYSQSEIDNDFYAFASGPECLEYLRNVLKNKHDLPSIILMDINMPEMTGFEVVKEIRNDLNLAEVPIIAMLSSSNEEEDVKKAYASGANEYFEKPSSLMDVRFYRND